MPNGCKGLLYAGFNGLPEAFKTVLVSNHDFLLFFPNIQVHRNIPFHGFLGCFCYNGLTDPLKMYSNVQCPPPTMRQEESLQPPVRTLR